MRVKTLNIKNLWGNDISWTFNEDVNVLIGSNGFGKSTVLKLLNEALMPIDGREINFRLFDSIDEIIIELEDGLVVSASSEGRSITTIHEKSTYETPENLFSKHFNISFISTFDVVDENVQMGGTLLDSKLEELKVKFITYQRDLSYQVEDALHKGESDLNSKIEYIYRPKKIFSKILSDILEPTNKKFDEKEFLFHRAEITTPISPARLSSGEKQMLIILLEVLLQKQSESILLMDEPEISFHIDWQRKLFQYIRQINDKCQIIATTHSPTIFYQGWIDKVFRIEEITCDNNSVESPEEVQDQKHTLPKIKVREGVEEIKRSSVDGVKDYFKSLSGNRFSLLYQFNRHIKAYTSFQKDECIKLLDFLRLENIYPDVITFTTFISKIDNYFDAKDIFDLIEKEEYSYLSHVKPNIITLNTLIKKVQAVNQGLELLQSVTRNEKLQLYPDIITFSTLLGKAKNSNDIDLIEEFREYFEIEANDIYKSKLIFKR